MTKTWFALWVLFALGVALLMSPERSDANSGDPAQAQSIASLRERSEAGLERALRDYDSLEADRQTLQEKINQLNADGVEGNKEALAATERQLAELERRIKTSQAVIDEIGGQRSCTVSRLFWHTDLDTAKEAAARTGRPILSLRMLGKLTDEFSCANSRFFRTALYSNKKVSDFLRANYVLHWQSVRPVPRVTIDFGDGRKLVRTITGNSAHYVLASDGTPLDVLPGLYAPQQFLEWLHTAGTFHAGYAAASTPDRASILQRYHASRRDSILQRWDGDLQQLSAAQIREVASRIDNAMVTAILEGQPLPDSSPAPNARTAGQRAESKYVAEKQLLGFSHFGGQWLEKAMDDELWRALAALHRPEVKLDDTSVAVMRKEFPAVVAMRVSVSKMQQEDPVLRMVRTFEDSMAVDTVRNEYLLHRQIHEQFASGNAITLDVDALNEWVYAELFLTPSSDPWLGLAPEDVYTALENDGRVEREPGFAIR